MSDLDSTGSVDWCTDVIHRAIYKNLLPNIRSFGIAPLKRKSDGQIVFRISFGFKKDQAQSMTIDELIEKVPQLTPYREYLIICRIPSSINGAESELGGR